MPNSGLRGGGGDSLSEDFRDGRDGSSADSDVMPMGMLRRDRRWPGSKLPIPTPPTLALAIPKTTRGA